MRGMPKHATRRLFVWGGVLCHAIFERSGGMQLTAYIRQGFKEGGH
jgi:hypothetical protein